MTDVRGRGCMASRVCWHCVRCGCVGRAVSRTAVHTGGVEVVRGGAVWGVASNFYKIRTSIAGMQFGHRAAQRATMAATAGKEAKLESSLKKRCGKAVGGGVYYRHPTRRHEPGHELHGDPSRRQNAGTSVMKVQSCCLMVLCLCACIVAHEEHVVHVRECHGAVGTATERCGLRS